MTLTEPTDACNILPGSFNRSIGFLPATRKQPQGLLEDSRVCPGSIAIAHQCRLVPKVELENTRQKSWFAGRCTDLIGTDAGQGKKAGKQFAVRGKKHQRIDCQRIGVIEVDIILHFVSPFTVGADCGSAQQQLNLIILLVFFQPKALLLVEYHQKKMFNKSLVKHDQRHFLIELKSYLFINHHRLSNTSIQLGLPPDPCPPNSDRVACAFKHDQQDIANGKESDDRRGQ